MTDQHGGHDPAHPDSDHGHDDHAAGGHGAADAHGHGGEALGPIDITMWGIGVVGVALGLLVALCVAFSTGVF
jgi:hypothetical protein